MDIFKLGPRPAYERQDLIENYDSLIWSDRYSSEGDIQINTKNVAAMKKLLPVGQRIVSTESDQIMIVESHEEKDEGEAGPKLTIKGRSFVSLLRSRIWVLSTISSNYKTSWPRAGTAGNVAASMVRDIAITGLGYSTDDIITDLTQVNLSSDTASFNFMLKLGTLYERVKEVCDSRDLGFKVMLVDGKFQFTVYSATDRSGSVIFDPDLDTLDAPSSLVSDENYKNVAYVFSPAGSRTVYAPGFSSSNKPLDVNRRVLYIDASDLTPDTAGATAMMEQRGREELAKSRKINLVDGVTVPGLGPKYGSAYRLGDLVTLKKDGVSSKKRISEYIWAIDENGERSYPTFSDPDEVTV